MLAPILDPGLSTIELPYERMARTGIELLLSGSAQEPTTHPIECLPILRGSVADAKVHA